MKFIDKLERKFGRLGIPNLTVYIIGCYVLGYFLAMFAPGVLDMLSLDMSMVMRGQIWRLVTWVIYPPSSVGGTGNLVMFLLQSFSFIIRSVPHWSVPGEHFGILYIFFQVLLFTVIAAVLLHVFTGGYVTMNGIMYSLGGSYFYHLLYQSFHFSGLCSHGYPDLESFAYVCHPYQDEMDGIYIRTFYCMGYCILS